MSRFINPYTFVPIEKKKPDRDKKTNGDMNGYIECSLEIKSPTFIPNTSKKFGDEHSEQVFYSYTNLENEDHLTDDLRKPEPPVIPGSEIRGMLRNVYEQLTNSCFVHIDEKNLPYKRTNEVKIPAIMVYDNALKKWKIYPSNLLSQSGKLDKGNLKFEEDYFKGFLGKIKDEPYFIAQQEGQFYEKESYENFFKKALEVMETGYCLTCNPQKIGGKFTSVKCNMDKNGEYYLHITPLMHGTNPHNKKEKTSNHVILYTTKNLKRRIGYELNGDAIKRFQYIIGVDEEGNRDDNIVGSYVNSTINRNKEYVSIYKNYRERYLKHEPLFVYVDKDSIINQFKNTTVYLAPACMSKEFFGNTIGKILEQNNEHQPCSDKNSLCLACRLFGMIGETGGSKGKLRFSDTYSVKDKSYLVGVTLPILATPRISSTEFYLESPDGFKNNGYNKIWNYDYYIDQNGRHSYNPRLAGRKVYWNGKFDENLKSEKGNMNTTVTPLNGGKFEFKIFFDRLTKEELDNLIFCIKPCDNALHKIGHGKPIGMGQIKLEINDVKLKSYKITDEEIGYSLCDYTEFQANDFTSDAAENIRAYMSEMSKNERGMVKYPSLNGNVFKWFVKNRGSVNKPKIYQSLPPIKSEDKSLLDTTENRAENRSYKSGRKNDYK